MSVGADPSVELEKERQDLLDELANESGPQWEDQYRPGSLGCHEFLDRTCLLADQVEKSILAHPSCALNPQWYALAARAVDSLRELYQRIGSEHL
jgi:hypothetical protein